MTKSIDEDTIKDLITHTKNAVAYLNSDKTNESDKQSYYQVFHRHQPEILLIGAIPAINDSDKMKIDRLLGAEQIKDTIKNTKSLFKLNALLDLGVLEIRPDFRQGYPSIEFHNKNFEGGHKEVFSLKPKKPSDLLMVNTEFYDWKGLYGTKRASMNEALHNVQSNIQEQVNEWKKQADLKNDEHKPIRQKLKA
ncbi:hypothetical protein ACXM5X_31695 [Pseudomonas saponiphila]